MSDAEMITETRECKGQKFEAALIKAPPCDGVRYPPLEPGTTTENGITVDRDVAVKMRDGITIYTDVYRPEGATNVPAIVCWSPYGKRTGYVFQSVPGVHEGTLSPGTKLEGIDPDFWCRRGYAVINPDARGAGHSEGVIQNWGPKEAEDIHDLIEWVGVQDWCNGKVGMAGNSWLAISQWHGAATKPPHLAAIAPWEGTHDPYRDIWCVGGSRQLGFLSFFDLFFGGDGMMEHPKSNTELHPFFDTYWQSKVPDLAAIDVPAYITGGWNHPFHLRGAIEGFNKISSTKKWLRLHREFEWPDLYTPENLDDLDRFFTRYLKGHHNGWEMTPRVRIDVMDRGDRDHVTRRAETAFPLPETDYRKLYLNSGDRSLSEMKPGAETSVTYDAETGTAAFDITFDRDTELTGFFKLRLWLETKGSDDADIFVALQKADASGTMIPTFVIGQEHPGAQGLLRASHRELDEAASTAFHPVQTHQRALPLKPGETVPLDIAILPNSRIYKAGERLRVLVSGHYTRKPGWIEPFEYEPINKGEHVIHSGGKYDSYLLIPYIPDPRPIITGDTISAAKLVPFGPPPGDGDHDH
jgi:uncharacterized protein